MNNSEHDDAHYFPRHAHARRPLPFEVEHARAMAAARRRVFVWFMGWFGAVAFVVNRRRTAQPPPMHFDGQFDPHRSALHARAYRPPSTSNPRCR